MKIVDTNTRILTLAISITLVSKGITTLSGSIFVLIEK